MCGIAGFFGINSLPRHINRASELLAHRGPDGSGIEKRSFVSKKGAAITVEFAHRRLSIVDLSKLGKQPFKDKHGRLLIFNGEIFNWKSLRRELEADGYIFTSHTDTEVILAGYDRWKDQIFERLNGFWALGLYDPHACGGPSLILSRDRCGIKPLYYMFATDADQPGIYFASEIRSLLALKGQHPEVIPDKVVEFTVKGSLSVDGETIYRNIQEFPIASHGVFQADSGTLKLDQYWSISHTEEIDDEEYALDQFSEIVEDAVDLWMHADVPVGLTLSSGIDSSVIAVAAERKGYRDITAFSSQFPGSPLDEFELASELASKLGMRHVPVTPRFDDLLNDVSRFSAHQETLFSSFSQFVAYCVYREIHAHGYKAFLAGQGGDELFLGYQRHLSSYIRKNSGSEDSMIRRMSNVHHNTTLSWPQILGFIVYFSGNRIRQTRGRIRAKNIFTPQYVEAGLSGAIKPIPSNLKKLQQYETFGIHQLRRLLRYDDRSSSSFGLEGRPVLLDHRLIEFAFSLSPRLLIKRGWTKYILRKYLERHGHSNVAWRKKKLGFPAPEKAWSEQWLKSSWPKAKSQNSIQDIILPNLNVEELGNWEKIALSVVAMTAVEMEW